MSEIKSIFEKFFTKNNFKFLTEETEFSVKISFKGDSSGIDNLSGLWKIVRESPFSKNKKIHTSFCNVLFYEKTGDYKLKIKDSDLRWDFFKSTGPGGQNKNKTLTAVRLTHVPTGFVVTSTQQRSQNDNKIQALKQLNERFWKEFEDRVLTEKSTNWQSNISDGTPNVILYFNHKLCSCEKTQRKSKEFNSFMSGNLSVLI